MKGRVHGEMLRRMLRPSARIVLSILRWIEGKVSPEFKLHYSPTFIIGPPRSGSTLLQQLVTYTLSVSYFTNLTGRLRVEGSPTIPIFTAKLAKILNLVEHHRETFESYYGNTKGLGGPDWGIKIWTQWFPDGYIGPGELSLKNQRTVYQAVAATERIFDRPFMGKGQRHSVWIQALVEIFPNAIFIQCMRDPLAMAQSIFIARTQTFPYLPKKPEDPRKTWFSVKPKEYDKIKDKGLIEQICEQVYFTDRNIEADRPIVGEGRFLFVHYRDLCRNPKQELEKIAKFMNDYGAPTQILRSTPDFFNLSSGCKIDKATYLAMADYLEVLYGRPMEIESSN